MVLRPWSAGPCCCLSVLLACSPEPGDGAGGGGAAGRGGAHAGGGASVAGASGAATAAGAGGAASAGTAGSFGTGGSVTAGSGGAIGGSAGAGGGPGGAGGGDSQFHVFLLFGQSNMEGVPTPEDPDEVENPRVKVLAYDNCQALGRTYNEWAVASPPLHSCWAGVGPGDSFGKALADALPDATIGLVPNAISGADIDMFRKDVVSSRRDEFTIAPDDHWSGAYEPMLARAKLAQQTGVIRGILLHQGESDNGSPQWLDKVKDIVDDLRADLNIPDVPLLAGELLYSGCCAGHNSLVAQLPDVVDDAHVISADGLQGMAVYHFDLAGQRELGARYAEKMLELLPGP